MASDPSETPAEVARVARTCAAVAELNRRYRAKVSPVPGVASDHILTALSSFMDCVRYLNTRRSSGAILTLDSEAAVQDALFLMLRPWLTDLTWENPTDKVSGRYVIKDFISPSAKAVVEAKYVRDVAHGKSITKELHDDIETYRNHPNCRRLIFFIYDPNAFIPDRQALEAHIGVHREYDGIELDCRVIVRP